MRYSGRFAPHGVEGGAIVGLSTSTNDHDEPTKILLRAAVDLERLGAMEPLEVCDAVEVAQASLRQLLLRLRRRARLARRT
jgi:hypothetical protein